MVIRYTWELDQANLSAAVDLRNSLQTSLYFGFTDYLEGIYGGGPTAPPSGLGMKAEYELVRLVQSAVRPVVAVRPFLLHPFGIKYLICRFGAGELGEAEVDDELAAFAETQGGRYSMDASLPSPEQRLAVFPELVAASWGGRTFCYFGQPGAVSRAIDAFELVESYRLLARVWIDYLDRFSLTLDRTEYDQSDILRLEASVVDASQLRQRISSSLVELNALPLAHRDASALRLVRDAENRLELAALVRLVNEKLDGLAQYVDVLSGVVDRLYQEVARRQGERLEALFSGAVVASITALVPALATLDEGIQSILIPVTAAATFVGWIAMAWLVGRLRPPRVSLASSTTETRSALPRRTND